MQLHVREADGLKIRTDDVDADGAVFEQQDAYGLPELRPLLDEIRCRLHCGALSGGGPNAACQLFPMSCVRSCLFLQASVLAPGQGLRPQKSVSPATYAP